MAGYIIEEQFYGASFGARDIMYNDYERCTFADCDFSACNFTGVAFIDCTFTRCNFNEAKINYVGLRNAFFDGCNFTGVNFAMVDALLLGIEFKSCRLDYAKFYTLKIKGTVFTDCSLIAADFMSADLTGALFDGCDLHKAVFLDTIAIRADFTTSYNYAMDPERNKLRRARFSKEGLKGLLEKHEIVVAD